MHKSARPTRTEDPGSAWCPAERKRIIDGWAADIPDSIGDGGPARRIKVDFATDVAWSFQKALGVR